MATEVLKRVYKGDARIAFLASWDDYLAIARIIGDQHVLSAYDGERIELMSPGMAHDDEAGDIEMMVRAIAVALGGDCKSMRSARWKRANVARGIEADASFYLTAPKIAVAKTRPEVDEDWPIPDLVIEVDMSPSKVDRPGIYAALGVPEVWRFDGESFRIDRLGPAGAYSEASESGWFGIRPDEAAPLLALDAQGDNDFSEQVFRWAREVLVPRRQGNGG